MKHLVGHCYLGRHAKESGYIYLPFVSNALVEPFIMISNEEMEEQGISMLLMWLCNGPQPGYRTVSTLEAATYKRILKLKREYLLASIELLQDKAQELKIIPLHAGRGWSFDTFVEEIRTVSLPITNQKLMEELEEVFEVAT